MSNRPRLPAVFGSEQVEPVKGIGAVGAGDVAAELGKVVAFQLRQPFDDRPFLGGGRADSDPRRGHAGILTTCQAG